jgi:cathepsin B
MKVLSVLLLCALALTAFAKKDKPILLDFKSIIDHVNSIQTTWKAGHNHYFDGMDLETIKHLMGTLETPEEQKLPLRDIEPLQDIPETFESAEAWPNCESIREVRDQSTCGSCWAFGAVEAISDRICVASGQKLQVRISAEDLLTCCGMGCGNGCNGGYPSGAFNHWKSPGIVTGWLYNTSNWCQPYTFPECDHHTTGKYQPCGDSKPTPKCKTTCVAGYSGSYATDRWTASSVYSVPSQVAKIQTEIMTNGPVEAAFTVYADFPTYKSGVYHHTTGSALGGHAIKIVGWGVENGTPYWTVANSWN